MSYKQIYYHIVFGTKNRQPTIIEEHCTELYRYIYGIIQKKHCTLYRINCIEDHIHLFSDLHPSIALADYIKDIKVASSQWMKAGCLFPDFRGWQDGYGAFTYSFSERDKIINYVKNQKIHHQTENFHDEFKRLLIENGIEFDEEYLM